MRKTIRTIQKSNLLFSFIAAVLLFAAGCSNPVITVDAESRKAGNTVNSDLIIAADTLIEINETTSYETLEIGADASFSIPEGYYLTMLVDGIETVIEEGVYSDVTLVLTRDTEFMGSWTWGGRDAAASTATPPFRAAAYIDSEGMNEECSVLEAVGSGKVFDDKANGIKIQGQTGDFSGIVVNNADYSIHGAKITLGGDTVDGSNTNDFAGLGAAVVVSGEDAFLKVNGSKIETTGVGKLPVFVDDGAVAVFEGCKIRANGGTIYDGYMSTADQTIMVAPPWVLGLDNAESNARGSNLMGDYSVAAYVDSDIYAHGWAGLSTDSGSQMHLIVVNSDIKVENSGYGTYNIGSATEDFYGVRMDVATIGIIHTGGQSTIRSSRAGEEINVAKMDGDTDEYGFQAEGAAVTAVSSRSSRPSEIVAGSFGIMAHQGTNVVNILDKTSITSGDAMFLIKGGNNYINVDDSLLKSESGVLLQLFDNDDPAVGLDMGTEWGIDDLFYGHTYGMHMPTFNESFTEGEGYSSEFGGMTDYGTSGICDLTLSNGNYEGDIWNSTGYLVQGAMGPASATGYDVTVTIGEGATLKGFVSAGEFSHVEKDLAVGNGDWSDAEYLGHVTNQVYWNGYNNIDVVVEEGAIWIVTGSDQDDAEGIITSLTNNGRIIGIITEVDEDSDGIVDYYTVAPDPDYKDDRPGDFRHKDFKNKDKGRHR